MTHSGVPEELGEHHEVSRVQREPHVSGGDGQNSHAAPLRRLEAVTQLLPLRRRRRAVDTDVTDALHTTQHHTTQHTAQHTTQHNTPQHSAQHNTAQHNTAHSTTQHSTAQHTTHNTQHTRCQQHSTQRMKQNTDPQSTHLHGSQRTIRQWLTLPNGNIKNKYIL